VDELDGHRSFAGGSGTSLRGPGAHVAGREDTGDARLEQVVSLRRSAGENEPVVVPRDGVVEPVRARVGAKEEEQERERKAFPAGERDGFEPASVDVIPISLNLSLARARQAPAPRSSNCKKI
jgi:hypothetical protein